jgi:glycosyltransferase involved in cell wall biosynthesis
VGRNAPAHLERIDWGGPVSWVHIPLRSSGSPARLAFELGALGLDARRRGVKLVHGLAYSCPIVAPGVATVVTLLDLTWIHDPSSVTPTARHMFRLLTATCGRAADRVIAISEAAREDLVRTAGIPGRKIDVTPLAAAAPVSRAGSTAAAVRARLDLPGRGPVLLCVGQVTPNKNHEVVLRALPLIPDAVLVVAGRRTEHQAGLEALAARIGVSSRIAWAGFVSDPDLEDLYALADVLVLASLHEGFGLPIVEAMVRDVPVACSDHGAVGEVAGDAAMTFDPRDPADVATAVRALLSDATLREDRVARGRRRARALSWEATARATLDSYRRALNPAAASGR